MTRGELETRLILLLSYAGYTDVVAPPIPTRLINQAWTEWSWLTEAVVAEITIPSVIGQMVYILPTGGSNPPEWKEIVDVSFNGLPLLASVEDYERYLRADWLVQPNGSPVRVLMRGGSQFRVIPPPDSIANFNVRAIAMGSDMTLETDPPGVTGGLGVAVPAAFHEGIALWAAWVQGKVYSSGEESDRIKGFFEESVSYAQRAHRFFWNDQRVFEPPLMQTRTQAAP